MTAPVNVLEGLTPYFEPAKKKLLPLFKGSGDCALLAAAGVLLASEMRRAGIDEEALLDLITASRSVTIEPLQ